MGCRASKLFGLTMIALLMWPVEGMPQVPIRFGKEEVRLASNVKRSCRWSRKEVDYGPAYAGKQNVLLELKRIPDSSDRATLRAHGVELKGYVGGQAAYFAQICAGLQPYELVKTCARAMVPIAARWKVADALLEPQVPEWAQRGSQVAITLYWFDNVGADFVARYVSASGWTLESQAPTLRTCTVVLPQGQVLGLAGQSWVQCINLVSPPMELYVEPSVVPPAGEGTLFRQGQLLERE